MHTAPGMHTNSLMHACLLHHACTRAAPCMHAQVDAGGGTMPSSCEDGIPAAGPAVGGGTAGSAAAAEADLNYIYGSHYSTPAYTVHFLVRLLPECLLRLHCGRFDCTHRIFRSMQGAWAGALRLLLLPGLVQLQPVLLQMLMLVMMLLLPVLVLLLLEMFVATAAAVAADGLETNL